MNRHFRFPTLTEVSGAPTTYFENLSPEVFQYPFFNQGVSATRKNFHERETSSSKENTVLEENELLPIKGFIFHTSHCGSTLLGRMIGSSSQVRMISEPESINGILLSYLLHQLPENQILQQLKEIIEAYRIPGDGKKSIIFKLTSWNVFLIDLFQKLYPTTPWIYIDRDSEQLIKILTNEDGGFIDWWHHPVDVLRKHFLDNTFTGNNLENYLQSIISGHRSHALAAKNANGLFLNYPDFLQATEEILDHFKLTFNQEELRKAISFQQFESKKFEPTLFDTTI